MRITLLTVFLILTMPACQPSNEQQGAYAAQQDKVQDHDHGQHQHGALDVESFGADTPIPAVSFSMEPDSLSGWNIQITTENIRFAPENVNQDAHIGEGHAHIYVDGFKMARVYSAAYHLKKLTPGPHQVVIRLSANDHSDLHYQGQPIAASQHIQQQ